MTGPSEDFASVGDDLFLFVSSEDLVGTCDCVVISCVWGNDGGCGFGLVGAFLVGFLNF